MLMPNWKSKLIRSWLFSYLAILLLPLIMGQFVYQKSIETMQEETLKNQKLSLHQIKGVVDGRLDELNSLYKSLTLNLNIQKLINASGEIGPDEILAVTYAQKDLNRMMVANSFLTDIFVYVENKDLLFSTVKKYEPQEKEALLFDDFGLSREQFQGMMTSPYIPQLLFPAGQKSAKTPRVLYVQTLYNIGYRSSNGLIFMLIDTDQISSAMNSAMLALEENLILLSENNGLFSTGDMSQFEDYSTYQAVSSLEESTLRRIHGRDYAISHIGSDLVGLRYASMIPTDVILQKVRSTRIIFYAYFILCLLAGVVLACVFSRKNHLPVKKLTALLPTAEQAPPVKNENEYHQLEKFMRTLLNENRQFETRLQKQERALINQLWIKLLKGRLSGQAQIAAAFEAYGVCFPSGAYVVALLSPDSGTAGDDQIPEDMVYSMIRNMMEDIAGSRRFSQTAEVDGMIACILQEGKEDAGKDDMDTVRIAVELFEQIFHRRIFAALGPVCQGVEQLCFSYHGALEGLERRQLLGSEERVIDCRSLPRTMTAGMFGSSFANREQLFLDCMRTGDFEDAQTVLESIMTDSFDHNPGDLQQVKLQMSGIVLLMLGAVRELGQTKRGDFGVEESLRRVLEAATTKELRAQVGALFEAISASYRQERDTQPPWLAPVEEYIARSYQNPDLNIASIAATFEINPSYLSRAYKKYRGTGLLEFIHQTRIERAKQLLRETESGLDDIAAHTGYGDSKALIRTFKKLEGITPGRFRENQRKVKIEEDG